MQILVSIRCIVMALELPLLNINTKEEKPIKLHLKFVTAICSLLAIGSEDDIFHPLCITARQFRGNSNFHRLYHGSISTLKHANGSNQLL